VPLPFAGKDRGSPSDFDALDRAIVAR
jgi:hypothetical protein